MKDGGAAEEAARGGVTEEPLARQVRKTGKRGRRKGKRRRCLRWGKEDEKDEGVKEERRSRGRTVTELHSESCCHLCSNEQYVCDRKRRRMVDRLLSCVPSRLCVWDCEG